MDDEPMMPYPTDEEWAEMDAMIERRMKLFDRIRYAAILVAFAILLFLIVKFVAAHSSPMHQDPFALECAKVLENLKGN